ncbi:MAG TPA: energy transducer TonB [Bacteroidetes bacterium]|nr:energy transducer TonB [Bacteroidota bacterium]
MKLSSLLLALVFLAFGCKKDSDGMEEEITIESGLCWVEVDGVFESLEVDKVPEFINGGVNGFVSAIFQYIKYPAEARENGIEGMVRLEYEITVDGEVENIVIAVDAGGGCGEASKSALEAATPGVSFFPAELNGEKVRTKKELPISFKLE